MRFLKQEEVFKNTNTDYSISEENQKKLMNGNAQFIIDLANNMQGMASYSSSILAIQMCHYFFVNKCYLNFDRF